MTSIDYLFNELWEAPKDKLTWHSILNKAKEMHKQEIETLYTEEQVREAINLARVKNDRYNFHIKPLLRYSPDEIIQSLKQPKKD